MRRILRRIGYALVVLVIVLAVLFAWFRVRGPSAEQRLALDSLQKDRRPAHGHNAFPLLWYMRYDVPDADIDARMPADIEEVSKRLAAGDSGTIPFEPSAPKLPEPKFDDPDLCQTRASDCLGHVTAQPELTRAALGKYARTLARAQAIEQADFLWSDFPADFRAPLDFRFPVAQHLRLSALALQFRDGDRAGALEGVCRNANAWRRLHGGTNSLIGNMISIVSTDGAIRLFAEMLAALPAGEPIPSACAEAFRPIEASDVDRCAEMAREFAIADNSMASSLRKAHSVWERFVSWTLFDPEQTSASRAEGFASYCGDAAARRMLADKGVDPGSPLKPSRGVGCIENLLGCVLTQIAAPAYVDYDARVLDFLAHIRLGRTMIWLHEVPHTPASLQELFEQRPRDARSDGHVSGVDLEHRVIFVESFNQRREKRFELPLSAGFFTNR